MRSMLAAVTLAACAHAPPPPAALPPPPTEAFIRARSHAVIDAYDRGDVPDWGNARTSLVRFVARKK